MLDDTKGFNPTFISGGGGEGQHSPPGLTLCDFWRNFWPKLYNFVFLAANIFTKNVFLTNLASEMQVVSLTELLA